MTYPCKGCLVITTCIKSCDKLIFFLDSLIGKYRNYNIPTEWIETKNKMERLLDCKNLYPSSKLFGELAIAYSIFHGESLWDTFGLKMWKINDEWREKE